MAHGEDARRAVRAAFVFEQLSLEVAAVKCGVPIGTVRRWKSEAKAAGDDWDKARAAQLLAGGGMEDVMRQTLAVIVQQTQATMEAISTAENMEPAAKVKLLASLSDSFNKLGAVSKRLMPETDRYGIATDVVKRLLEFSRDKYPQHVGALAELLRPFGDELTRAYGS